MAKRIALALEQAGVRPSQRTSKVGDLDLKELLDEGPGYQDFAAVHPRSGAQHRGSDLRDPDATRLQRELDHARGAARVRAAAPRPAPGDRRARSTSASTNLGLRSYSSATRPRCGSTNTSTSAAPSLNLFDRLALIRDLAEAVASAHGRRLAHRALSPRSVLVVRPGTAEQRLCIINWQTGSRDGGRIDRGHGRGHTPRRPADRHEAAAYLAPEALTVADADPQLLDVFSLGAIAYRVFTGQAAGDHPRRSHRAPAARRRPRGLSHPRRRW